MKPPLINGPATSSGRRSTPTRARARNSRLAVILALGVSYPIVSPAETQEDSVPDASVDSAQVVTAAPLQPVAKAKNGDDLVVVPIPMHDPSQGWGLLLAAQYIFKPKAQAAATPPSIVGLGTFYTEQKSYGFLAGYLGHWKDDLWRPVFAAGYVNVNYDFYGIGTDSAELDVSIPIEQEVLFGVAQVMRRLRPHLYAGLRVTASQTEIISSGVDQPPIVLPPLERTVGAQGGGPVAQWDSRDNQFYPTTGNLVKISAMFYAGDREYQTYRVQWNHYRAFGEVQVLALRANLRAAVGDVPFYALSQFGQGSDLRGYKSGKYRDKNLVDVQVEYRRQLTERWGVVAFAGVGEVVPSFDELNTDDLLGSVGAGIRFRVSKKNPINLRLDWAYGKDGDATHVSVNEAF